VPANDPDKMKVLFGTVLALVVSSAGCDCRPLLLLGIYPFLRAKAQPADIPESMGWWLRQQRDLLAMSADEARSFTCKA